MANCNKRWRKVTTFAEACGRRGTEEVRPDPGYDAEKLGEQHWGARAGPAAETRVRSAGPIERDIPWVFDQAICPAEGLRPA